MSPIALPPNARSAPASRRPAWWLGAALALLCGWLWLAGSLPAAATDAPRADIGAAQAATAPPAGLPTDLDPSVQRLPTAPDAEAATGVTAEPDVLIQAIRHRRHTPAGRTAAMHDRALSIRARPRAYRGRAPPFLA